MIIGDVRSPVPVRRHRACRVAASSTEAGLPFDSPLQIGHYALVVEREWRPRLAGRVAAWLAIVVAVPLAVWAVIWGVLNDKVTSALLMSALLILYAIGRWRWALHPRLIVLADGIKVRNGFSEQFVEWAEVDRCAAGYMGIVVVKKDGGTVTAFAVQKSNAMAWLNRRTRADEVAEYIERRARLRV